MRPRMIVIAGPPGSGKSSVLPASAEGVSFFNADDRAAELNGGSHRGIPEAIRDRVNREFEAFVAEQIEERSSFAIETTLQQRCHTPSSSEGKRSWIRSHHALHRP